MQPNDPVLFIIICAIVLGHHFVYIVLVWFCRLHRCGEQMSLSNVRMLLVASCVAICFEMHVFRWRFGRLLWLHFENVTYIILPLLVQCSAVHTSSDLCFDGRKNSIFLPSISKATEENTLASTTHKFVM